MKTNIKTGLTDKEVTNNRNKYGSNKLTSKKKNTFLKLVIESLSDPIIKILLIALAIKILFTSKNLVAIAPAIAPNAKNKLIP